MTTAGRTPGVNYAKKAREYFEANRNRDITLDDMRVHLSGGGELIGPATTRGVVNYLRAKGMRLTVVKRGQVWRYNKVQRQRKSSGNPNRTEIKEGAPIQIRSNPEFVQRMHRLANKLVDPATEEKWRETEVLNDGISGSTKFWFAGHLHGRADGCTLLLKSDNGKAYVAREL